MSKNKVIGGTSFTEEGYEKFVSLPKEKQIDKIYNGLSPKDRGRAEELLKSVPHGNINSGNDKKVGEGKTSDTTGNIKANSEKPGSDKS